WQSCGGAGGVTPLLFTGCKTRFFILVGASRRDARTPRRGVPTKFSKNFVSHALALGERGRPDRLRRRPADEIFPRAGFTNRRESASLSLRTRGGKSSSCARLALRLRRGSLRTSATLRAKAGKNSWLACRAVARCSEVQKRPPSPGGYGAAAFALRCAAGEGW